MKILLTGASGFIGKAVKNKLIKKYGMDSIRVCSLLSNYFMDCSDIEVVLHIGAWIPKTSADVNSILDSNSNISTTQKLLSFKFHNLKKIIFISTVDVYATQNLIDENSSISPVSLYGYSKFYCEKMIDAYAKQKSTGFQVLRIGHTFGPGEEAYKGKLIPLTICKVLNDEAIDVFGDGQAVRSFIFIDDVADAIVNAVELSAELGIINLVGDEKITINELVNKIINLSGKDIKTKHIISDTQNRNYIFDNTKLKKYLLPKLTSFNDGLKSEYEYMLKIYKDDKKVL
jgi:nucleoside-diphosphate-sugar epimerase